mgnify:CR=1 FL=1
MAAEEERNAVRGIGEERRFPSSGESFDSYILEGIPNCWHLFGCGIQRSDDTQPTYTVVDHRLLQHRRQRRGNYHREPSSSLYLLFVTLLDTVSVLHAPQRPVVAGNWHEDKGRLLLVDL